MSFPWVELTSIGVPALVAVASAIYAGREARRAQQSEREADKLRRLEERVSQHKYEVYQPIIEAFSQMLRGKAPKELESIMDRFSAWHLIYGSDDAIQAYGHLMQTIYAQPEPQILVRMYAEFFISARRDLGYAETTLTELAVMEPRITDLYSDKDYYEAIALPQSELFKKFSWTPPWAAAVTTAQSGTSSTTHRA